MRNPLSNLCDALAIAGGSFMRAMEQAEALDPCCLGELPIRAGDCAVHGDLAYLAGTCGCDIAPRDGRVQVGPLDV